MPPLQIFPVSKLFLDHAMMSIVVQGNLSMIWFEIIVLDIPGKSRLKFSISH